MPLNFGGQKRSGAFDTVWPSAKKAKTLVPIGNLQVGAMTRHTDIKRTRTTKEYRRVTTGGQQAKRRHAGGRESERKTSHADATRAGKRTRLAARAPGRQARRQAETRDAKVGTPGRRQKMRQRLAYICFAWVSGLVA